MTAAPPKNPFAKPKVRTDTGATHIKPPEDDVFAQEVIDPTVRKAAGMSNTDNHISMKQLTPKEKAVLMENRNTLSGRVTQMMRGFAEHEVSKAETRAILIARTQDKDKNKGGDGDLSR